MRRGGIAGHGNAFLARAEVAVSVTRPTIYVVDDDTVIHEALRIILQSLDMDIVAYRSGTEFLARYDPGRPGCLILDVHMPGMDGFSLQRELASREITIPIIFLTGQGDVPMANRAMLDGAFDFLAKPPKIKKLLETVKRAVEWDAHLRRRRSGCCCGMKTALNGLGITAVEHPEHGSKAS